jgi:hypothetical protein
LESKVTQNIVSLSDAERLFLQRSVEVSTFIEGEIDMIPFQHGEALLLPRLWPHGTPIYP